MKIEQKQFSQIKKCPVCECAFGENSMHLRLDDWIIVIESEGGFVPLLRCTSCYSPFYVKRKSGTIETYLGDGTK